MGKADATFTKEDTAIVEKYVNHYSHGDITSKELV